MPTVVQIRRGTTAENNNFIGQSGELTVDTSTWSLRVHDSLTPGGHIAVGTVGPAGPAGASGPTGPVGNNGLAGAQGPTGADGARGPQGLQGAQGIPGNAGAPGATGPQGPAGPAGPAGAQGPSYMKAWVNFNGITGTIRSSYNVTSITKNSTGDYTIIYTTALPDANYAVIGMGAGDTVYASYGVYVQQKSAPTTSSCAITTRSNAGVYVDPITVNLVVFGN